MAEHNTDIEGVPFTAENVEKFLKRRKSEGETQVAQSSRGSTRQTQKRRSRIKTVGQLKRIADALKNVPEKLRSRIIGGLLGISPGDTKKSDRLGEILFRHKVGAGERQQERDISERRFQQRTTERKAAGQETQKFREGTREFQQQSLEQRATLSREGRADTTRGREAGLDLREREFEFRKRQNDKEVLTALKQLQELKEKAKQSGNKRAVAVFNQIEVRLLSKLLMPRAKITRE